MEIIKKKQKLTFTHETILNFYKVYEVNLRSIQFISIVNIHYEILYLMLLT